MSIMPEWNSGLAAQTAQAVTGAIAGLDGNGKGRAPIVSVFHMIEAYRAHGFHGFVHHGLSFEGIKTSLGVPTTADDVSGLREAFSDAFAKVYGVESEETLDVAVDRLNEALRAAAWPEDVKVGENQAAKARVFLETLGANLAVSLQA